MEHKKLLVQQCIPMVPFKGINKFADIGGLLANPNAFIACIDLLEDALQGIAFTSIGCFDARGFLFGPMLATRMNKKVFMLRKQGKMPRVSHQVSYSKEYKGDDADGIDTLCIQENAVALEERVVLIDDVIATGGTIDAGIQLIHKAKGKVVACAFVVQIAALEGTKKILSHDEHIRVHCLLSDNDF